MTNHYAEAERLLGQANHFSYGDGADAAIGQALATEGAGCALLAIADRLDTWLALQKPVAPAAPWSPTPWTEADDARSELAEAATDTAILRSPEYRDTAAVVHRVIESFAEDSPAPSHSIDLDDMDVREYLTYAITKALVGGEGEQPEQMHPDLTSDEQADARRVDVVISCLRQAKRELMTERDIADSILFRLSKVDRDESEQPETADEAPRTFAVPEMPQDDVPLCDRDGAVWRRDGSFVDGRARWAGSGRRWFAWPDLLTMHGPLTEAVDW